MLKSLLINDRPLSMIKRSLENEDRQIEFSDNMREFFERHPFAKYKPKSKNENSNIHADASS